MVHTAELITDISKREYTSIRAAGAESFTGKGIRELKVFFQDKPYTPRVFYCKIIINLNRVAEMGKITPIPFTVTRAGKDKLANGFRAIMSNILPVRANIALWGVIRIDYTRDIKTECVKEYIELLQRGGKPPFTHIDNQAQHKKEIDKTHFTGSVRYHSKSVKINIYDKYEERKAKTDIDYPKELLEECRNVLRVEIQCLREKKNRIRHTHGIAGNSLLDLLISEEEQEKMIRKYLTPIAGTQDYYTFSEAAKIIDESDLKANTKTELKGFLTLIAKNKSVWKVQQRHTGKRTGALLTKLKAIGVNPVTIPYHWGKRRFTTIFHLLC